MQSNVKTQVSRIIGELKGKEEGPWIITVGGMHGNEPGGVEALSLVIEDLKTLDFKGQLLAIRGNLAAIKKYVRYIDEDMNRIWFPEIVDEVIHKHKDEISTSERKEVKKTATIIADFLKNRPKNSQQPILFLDFHSFSANGDMFGITHPHPENLELFSNLNVPIILDLEKFILGAAFDYYQSIGYKSFVFEGGQHEDPITAKNIAAVMLTILENLACFDAKKHAQLQDYKLLLAKQNAHLPKCIRVIFRHSIEPEDNFTMRPGFQNMQKIQKDEWLANDKSGKILSPMDGFIVMPLYQKQGSNGFFIAIEETLNT